MLYLDHEVASIFLAAKQTIGMASVFLYHVVGDLTVGKPEVVEFHETETVESAIRAIGESTEGGLPVWRKKSHMGIESPEMRQQRFVGILNSLDIVAFLSRNECLENTDKAMNTSVSELVVRNNSLMKQVDPATRLLDALEMMKQNVKRLLVRKSAMWTGMSKRFSVLYHGRWLKNLNSFNGSSNNLAALNRPSLSTTTTTTIPNKFCCLSREDVIRFLIGCLGALAPIPLSSINSLEVINPKYDSIDASVPAIEVTDDLPRDPSAVAVLEPNPEGQYKIIGEISASRLWKCDYLAAAWALANLSAEQFVMGIEDNIVGRSMRNLPLNTDKNVSNGKGEPTKPNKFSSRSVGFFSTTNGSYGIGKSMYRGRSAPLTCKVTSSLAAVMAQMLSHRATHVWVTEDGSDDVLVGVMGYADILSAVTKQPSPVVSVASSYKEGFSIGTSFQN